MAIVRVKFWCDVRVVKAGRRCRYSVEHLAEDGWCLAGIEC